MTKQPHISKTEAEYVLAEVARVFASDIRRLELRPPVLLRDWWWPRFPGQEKNPKWVVDYAVYWDPFPDRWWTQDSRLTKMTLPPGVRVWRYNSYALGIFRCDQYGLPDCRQYGQCCESCPRRDDDSVAFEWRH